MLSPHTLKKIEPKALANALKHHLNIEIEHQKEHGMEQKRPAPFEDTLALQEQQCFFEEAAYGL